MGGARLGPRRDTELHLEALARTHWQRRLCRPRHAILKCQCNTYYLYEVSYRRGISRQALSRPGHSAHAAVATRCTATARPLRTGSRSGHVQAVGSAPAHTIHAASVNQVNYEANGLISFLQCLFYEERLGHVDGKAHWMHSKKDNRE